jgi:transcriptional regulator with XRE-family HTH domain
MESLHEKIRRLRELKKLTQAETAEFIGISRVAYSQIENNITKNISIEIGKKLAKAFDIPFIELFEIESNVPQSEIDKLKVLVFHSLEKYESNQLFLKQFEHDQLVSEDWANFEIFRKQRADFKKGFYETLVNVGFCTQEDISEFYKWVRSQGKAAWKKQMPPESSESAINE